jgi:thiol-disulfide isomerase/thioredoxin
MLLMLGLISDLQAAAPGEEGITFRSLSFKAALAAARQEGKMVFIDCYTSWCVPCRMMAAEIFPQKACGDMMNPKFVSIKLDMEKGEGKELQKQFKVTSFPTFIMMDKDGKEINRMVGGSSTVEEFLQRLTDAVNPENSLPALKASYAENHNMQTGLKLIETLMANNEDAKPAIRQVFDNGMEFERYNQQLLRLALSATGIRDSLFDHLMLFKPQFDQALGHEVVNRMIFDQYRKDMYVVASGRQHDYTLADVKKAAQLTALLGMPFDQAETHLPHIALLVMEKDYDALTDYYTRFIGPLSNLQGFKNILNSILDMQLPNMSSAQRQRVKKYYEDNAKYLQYDAQQATAAAQRVMNQQKK